MILSYIDQAFIMKYQNFYISIVLLFAFLSLHCTESLPVYQEPQKIVECDMRYEAPSPIMYSHMDENEPSWISLGSPTTKIVVSVTNLYEETIQDEPPLFNFGYIEIWHPNKPAVYRKIPITLGNLINAGVYDPSTKVLTLDPNREVQFHIFWDYKDSSKTYVFMGMPILSDIGGNRILKPIPFKMRTTIQIFSRLAPIRSEEYEMILNFTGRIFSGP